MCCKNEERLRVPRSWANEKTTWFFRVQEAGRGEASVGEGITSSISVLCGDKRGGDGEEKCINRERRDLPGGVVLND